MFVSMRYESVTVENLAVDGWNGLGAAAQRSTFSQADPTTFIAPKEGTGLVLRNFTVGGVRVSLADDNWRASQLGRLDFAANMWGYWTAV